MNLERLRAGIRDAVPSLRRTADHETGPREALNWIYRAQDAGRDRGVSHSYLLGKGWMSSYPETTGYIIPTLLNWADFRSDPPARTRALEMSDWECQVQYADGSITGSVVGSPTSRPVVFNTGQVVFGWLAAFRETAERRYLESADRAVSWLIDELGEDETWTTSADSGPLLRHTYHARVVWAVLEYETIRPSESLRARMSAVLGWMLSQENGRGWFDNNCLNHNSAPLLHTIAYTAQGLVECGVLLGDERCVEAARRTADALLSAQHKDGHLPGRLDREWRPVAGWSCLTGIAQTSLVWRRLHLLTGDPKYREASERANRYLRTRQDVGSSNPGVRGGVAGSFPVWGGYGTYRILNWATKFTLDAYLYEEHPDRFAPGRHHPG